LKIHEYQAKQIFKKAGILVPEGDVATNIEKAIRTSEEIGLPVVIKAQVHVGGRGKAGGVKIAKTPEEVKKFAGEILGMDIKGLTVKKILVGKAIDIQRELYIGVITDRSTNHPVIMVSTEGGVDIEEVAKKTPEKIHRFTVDPAYGLLVHHAMNLAFKLSSDVKEVREIASTLQKLYRTYLDSDASLAEINPYVLSDDSNFYAIDAKIVLDDNALFRHPDYEEMRDLTLEEKIEHEAKEKGLSYISMEGNIGCVVNGAGLAMTTMDVIKHFGGEPANFLDVGGSSDPQKVKNALHFLLMDEGVRAIWFNIFGGITRCDDIASGLLEAVGEMEIELPLVVRLTGTNEEEGKRILSESGLDIHFVRNMEEGAKAAIRLGEGGG